MKRFARLDIYHDVVPRWAALNMAIDEALLETAKIPSMRFYRWNSLALSFGYFGKFADVANYAAQCDLVRRWTGGGIVFHEDDLTYSIIIPTSVEFFSASSKMVYAAIHSALRDALITHGEQAQLAEAARQKISESCFANPVHADVLVNGRKVAGGAQRRTRAGLLHQGSIQNVDLGNGLAERFAKELSDDCSEKLLGESLIERAHELAEQKYSSVSWLQRR